MTNYTTIQLDINDKGVASLTLDRVEVHNAMNSQLIAEMQSALQLIEDSDDIRVLVLSGMGKTFCAGGDLNWMKANITKARNERVAESGELADMLAMLDNLSKPLIGRIQGSAFGGGIGMMSVCDIAIGVDNAKFGLTEVKLGLTPATISPYVVKRMGATHARRNFLNARVFGAQEAQQMGLLTEVVSAESLDDVIQQEINLLLKCAPSAIAMSKQLIRYVDIHNDEENRSYTTNMLADVWETEEAKEGIDAFLNKRKASWIRN